MSIAKALAYDLSVGYARNNRKSSLFGHFNAVAYLYATKQARRMRKFRHYRR